MQSSPHLAILLLSLGACAGRTDGGESNDRDPTPGDGPEPVLLRLEGDVPDAGLGSAVAVGGAGAWASAPHGPEAVVFLLDPDTGLIPQLTAGGRAGLALATDHTGSLLIGAPLLGDGAVLDREGNAVLQGGGVGLGVGPGPVALDAGGWTDGAGGGVRTGARPSSIAVAGTQVAVGMAFGPDSALIGTLAVPRENPSEGFAIAGADLNGDGVPEWAIGAPQAGLVRVLTSDGQTMAELSGEGRFGAALSMADLDGDGRAELLVGAPRARSDAGEAVLYDGDLQELQRFRGMPSDRLGTAVALAPEGVLLGAPGGPGQPGAVVWIRELRE